MIKRVGFFVSRHTTWRDVELSGCSGWRSGTRAGTLKVTMTLISFSSANARRQPGRIESPLIPSHLRSLKDRIFGKPEVTMRSSLPPLTRRALFAGTGGALGWAAFRGDSIARVVQAGRAAEGKTPSDLVHDEAYWTQIS